MRDYQPQHPLIHAMRRVVPDVKVEFIRCASTDWRETLPYVRNFCLRRAIERRKLRDRLRKQFRFKSAPCDDGAAMPERPPFQPQTLQEMQRDLFLYRMEHRYKYMLWPKRFRQIVTRTVITYFGCKRKQWRYANDRSQGAWKPLHDEADAAQVRTRMRVRYSKVKTLRQFLIESGLRDENWEPQELAMGLPKPNALVDTALNRHVFQAHRDLDIFTKTGRRPVRYIDKVQHNRIRDASWILGLDAALFENYGKVQQFRDAFITWEYRIKAIYRRTRDALESGLLPHKAVSALCFTAETFLAHMNQRLRTIVRQMLNSELKVVTSLLQVADVAVRYRVWVPHFPRKTSMLLHGWANTSPDRSDHSLSHFETGMRKCLAHLAVALQTAHDVAAACEGDVVLNSTAYNTLVFYYRETVVPPNIIHQVLFHCLVSIVHPPRHGQGGRPRQREILSQERIRAIANQYEFEIEVPEPQDEECKHGAGGEFVLPALMPAKKAEVTMEEREAHDQTLALSLSTLQLSGERTHLQNLDSMALNDSDSEV